MTDRYLGWKRWHSADFGRFLAEDAIYYDHELRASGIASTNGLCIGELGYGNGAFAGWAKAGGAHWVGREAIPELHERALQAGFEAIHSDIEFPVACGPGKLDLIVAFDVIEHLDLEAIRSFMGESWMALKSGGMMLLRMPSGDSPFSGAIYRGDLTHRTLLGSGAVRQLAMQAGFDVRQTRPPVLPVWGLGLRRALRRASVHVVQALVFSAIRRLLMSQESAVVSPNMIVVLRKESGAP